MRILNDKVLVLYFIHGEKYLKCIYVHGNIAHEVNCHGLTFVGDISSQFQNYFIDYIFPHPRTI